MAGLIKQIKTILWKIGLVKNCPWCGSELRQIGHTDEDFFCYYRCTGENCNFGKN